MTTSFVTVNGCLDLSQNPLKNGELPRLIEVLRNDPTLTHLNLHDNQIGTQGAQVLAEALKVNRTLTQLDLWNNQIRAQGAQALSKALQVNRTLTQLSGVSSELISKVNQHRQQINQREELAEQTFRLAQYQTDNLISQYLDQFLIEKITQSKRIPMLET